MNFFGVILFPLLGVFILGLAAPALAVPEIETWRTENGARVYFVKAAELPMVDLRVVFDAGSARDGEQPGLALLTSSMLAQGAAGLDADAIASRFEAVGAHFSARSLRDMAIVSLRSLTEPDQLAQALETMARVLDRPDFPEAAFERERTRALVSIRNRLQSPGEVAERAFYQALYSDHPYAGPPAGSEESVAALQRSNLVEHHRRYYVGSNALVAIVGAVDRKTAERLAEQVVGGLEAGESAPALPPVKPPSTGTRIDIEHPSTQSHILVGQPAIERGHPDYFPLQVGNHILGGGSMVSRLFDEVREKRGLSYSVYSYFAPMAGEGPFVLGLQTANRNVDAALAVLHDTLVTFLNEGPTAAELEQAIRNITGGFPLQISSNAQIVSQLAMIGFYDLPLDYLDAYPAKVKAVTAAAIREAFRRQVDPERLKTIVVGGR